MILSLILLFFPASAITPATLAKQATAVIKAKGIVIPKVVLTEGTTPITAHGWIYSADPICGVTGAATYLEASDGTRDLSVAIVIPMNGKGADIMVTAHDLDANGTADYMTQDGTSVLFPDERTHKLFYGMLTCIVSPQAPK